MEECMKHNGVEVKWDPKKRARCPICTAGSFADEPPITFVTPRVKKLEELTGDDIPPGMDPYDCAIDMPNRRRW